MARMVEFREKIKKKTRFEAFKSIFSSLTVTVAAVVIAATVIPKSAVASFAAIEPYANEIIYHVDVTDEENAIIAGTLKVVLECQDEYYEQSLELGTSSGIFTGLKTNTEYSIRVEADKGFGTEYLVNDKVKTESRAGGAITGYELISSGETSYLEYDIGFFLADPETELTGFTMTYYVLMDKEYIVEEETTVQLLPNETSVSILVPYYDNSSVYIEISGEYVNGEKTIFDQLTFDEPLYYMGSFYIEQVTNDMISVIAYAEPYGIEDIRYELHLQHNKVDLQVIEITPSSMEEGYMHECGEEIVFSNLRHNRRYDIKLFAYYQDPTTLAYVERVVYEESVTTMQDFDCNVDVTETIDAYLVTVTIVDSSDTFQNAYYGIYQTVDYGDGYIYDQLEFWRDSDFTVNAHSKIVMFTINKPDYEDWHIEIGISSDTEYYYYYIVTEITP
ncbi:MAG TPA: hypothetical protein PLP02_05390 [Bacillota bacterium]|nr:hypothetical protein [Bacillota bacterium]